jgi:hypothetical protein
MRLRQLAALSGARAPGKSGPSVVEARHGTVRQVAQWVVFALGLSVIWADRATACATCECGDPTLVVMGAEQPFAQRLRLSTTLRHRTDAVGAGTDRMELNEQRLELAVAYAPVEWLMLSYGLPLLRRQLDFADLSRAGFVGIGDSELRARAFVYRDRDLAPHHLVALVAGLKLPTGPIKTQAGDLANPELLAGTGSFDPLFGATYSYFAHPWSLFASEVLFLPTKGARDLLVGRSWRGTHTLQYQALPALALRVSIETRLERRSHQAGLTVPDTGGFLVHVAPGVVVSPLDDLVIQATVHVPVLNALYGNHDEGPVFELGVALDV